MINDLESHSTSAPTPSQPSSSHRAPHRTSNLGHLMRHLAQPYQPDAVQPEYSSLWDLHLLDRLTTPLTRYHE